MALLFHRLRSIIRIERDTATSFPPTYEQTERRNQDFIDSIDEVAICSLASRYNNQAPCRVEDVKHGSFNVCFILDFYTVKTKWVVRIPIEPAVHNARAKLQREVATMQYIQRKTRIPIPKVITYRQNETLTKGQTTQAFPVFNYIPGRPFDKNALLESNKDCRKSFFVELLEVSAQFSPSYATLSSPVRIRLGRLPGRESRQ